MFAVVENGGKQYYAKPGSVLKVERLDGSLGEIIQLQNVIACESEVGSPYLKNVKVTAEVLGHDKTDKVIVFKKKRRHNYRRKHGHRQNITVLRVKEIVRQN